MNSMENKHTKLRYFQNNIFIYHMKICTVSNFSNKH